MLYPFTFQNIPVRGRLLRLAQLEKYVHTLKDAPNATAHLLVELLAAAALLVHDAERQFHVNLQVSNTVTKAMAFAHCSHEAHLKAYANPEMQATSFAELGQRPDSHFAVSLTDVNTQQIHQSLVGLIYPSAAVALENYFTKSVQTPTYFRVAVWEEGESVYAGALMVQALPGLEPDGDDWHRLNLLLNTLQPEELAGPILDVKTLLQRVFAEDTLMLHPAEKFTLQADDPRPRMLAALATLAPDELRSMLNENDEVTLTDQTSGIAVTFTAEELAALLPDATTVKH